MRAAPSARAPPRPFEPRDLGPVRPRRPHAKIAAVTSGLRIGESGVQVGKAACMDGLFVWFAERIVASGGVVPAFIDYFAVIVGAVTGAMFACERRLDIVGTAVCGLLTAYGGGILRDFLLQDEGVYFMAHPYLFLLCVALCAFVFYFQGLFRHLNSTVFLCDALSVALYAVAGASKAYACDSGVVMSVVLGGIVGVGGGAIRDSFVGEVPGIFKASNYYAVAALAGSLVYVAAVAGGLDAGLGAAACVAAVLVLRYASVYFGWRTGDDPVDLTPYVSRPIKRAGYVAKALFLGGGVQQRRRYGRRFAMKRRAGARGFARGDEADGGPQGALQGEGGGLERGCGGGSDALPRADARAASVSRDGGPLDFMR